jgi:uncharacterized protein DUF4062
MGGRAEVFISAATRELSSYREEVKNALLTLKILPIVEREFRLAHGPLVTMLRDLIGACDAVIHLAGFDYGAEPPPRQPGDPRRSYTQIENDIAREFKKPLFLFLASEDCQPDSRCVAQPVVFKNLAQIVHNFLCSEVKPPPRFQDRLTKRCP